MRYPHLLLPIFIAMVLGLGCPALLNGNGPSPRPTFFIGVAIGVSKGAAGYVAFIRSALSASPDATILLLVDDAVVTSLGAEGFADGSPPRLRLLRPPPRLVPAKLSHLSPIMSRYWLYAHAIEVAAAMAGHASAADRALVFLLDTRDLVLQRDPFVRMARLVDGNVGAARSERRRRPTLVAAAEPAYITMGGTAAHGWNWRVATSCFRGAALAPYVSAPVLCGGTTGGELPAVRAYLRAMTAAMPFCTSGGRGFIVGVDQALHNVLLHPLVGRVEAALVLHDSDSSGSVVAGANSTFSPDSPASSSSPENGGVDEEPADSASFQDGTPPASPSSAYFPLGSGAAAAGEREDAYVALEGIIEALGHAVRVVVTHHEEGEVCTVGSLPPNRVPLSVAVGGHGYWSSDVVVAAVRGEGQLGVDATLGGDDGLLAAAVLIGTVATPASIPCAIVHQYDRHMQLWKWVAVRWKNSSAVLDTYCDTVLNECW